MQPYKSTVLVLNSDKATYYYLNYVYILYIILMYLKIYLFILLEFFNSLYIEN